VIGPELAWRDPLATNTSNALRPPSWTSPCGTDQVGRDICARIVYATRLDLFILTSTCLVFFSLIEVLITTILESNRQAERAKNIDRYCRIIFPVIFITTSIAIFAHPRT